jgi:ABC-type cobalamin/Fe3+-siderophores transport system ATPase subunit
MVATAKSPLVADQSATKVIDIRGLSKTYRLMTGKTVEALSGLTLDIRKGETFAIVGPNGSGKTTTMKILLGMLFHFVIYPRLQSMFVLCANKPTHKCTNKFNAWLGGNTTRAGPWRTIAET